MLFSEFFLKFYQKLTGKNSSLAQQLIAKQTHRMNRQYAQYAQRLNYSNTQLKAYRNKRLRELLYYAKAHSPWYSKELASIKIDYFTENNLSDLPSMNKLTLMQNWDEIVTDRRLTLALVEKHISRMNEHIDSLYLLDEYHVLASSGSSGTRGVFVYNWDEWIAYYLNVLRYSGVNAKKRGLLSPPHQKIILAQVVVTNTVYALYSAAVTFPHEHVKPFYFPITLPMKEIVYGLNKTQPDILQATPSVVYKLCKEAMQGRLVIQPTVVRMGGEPLYKPIRALIKKVWPNSNIYNSLGTSEGLCAINCKANGEVMHLNDDACIVEPVNQQNEPVTRGILPEKIYLTNLYNYTLPLIRYESADKLLFLDKECPCGIKHQVIAEPDGRPEFDFYYKEIFVHHLLFVTHLLLEENIQEYQVQQTKVGANIKIKTIGAINEQRLITNITNELSQLGLIQPLVEVFRVEQFDYLPSGKLRRFIKLQSSHE